MLLKQALGVVSLMHTLIWFILAFNSYTVRDKKLSSTGAGTDTDTGTDMGAIDDM